MTLIDKAALLNRIATEVHYDSERSLEMYAKLLNEINDAPDALVRCKDCKYYYVYDRHNFCDLYLENLRDLDPNYYCASAERKEDGDNH